MSLGFDLDDEHELLRDTVRQFALEKVAPVAEELDREKRFPYDLVAEVEAEAHVASSSASSTIRRTP